MGTGKIDAQEYTKKKKVRHNELLFLLFFPFLFTYVRPINQPTKVANEWRRLARSISASPRPLFCLAIAGLFDRYLKL
jgi:hypothetical protein